MTGMTGMTEGIGFNIGRDKYATPGPANKAQKKAGIHSDARLATSAYGARAGYLLAVLPQAMPSHGESSSTLNFMLPWLSR